MGSYEYNAAANGSGVQRVPAQHSSTPKLDSGGGGIKGRQSAELGGFCKVCNIGLRDRRRGVHSGRGSDKASERVHHLVVRAPLSPRNAPLGRPPKAWNSSQTFPPRRDDSKASARRKHPSGPHANRSHLRYMPLSILRMCRRFRGIV